MKKNKSQVRISVFQELPYKEKRKRNLCEFARFYESVQTGFLTKMGSKTVSDLCNIITNAMSIDTSELTIGVLY